MLFEFLSQAYQISICVKQACMPLAISYFKTKTLIRSSIRNALLKDFWCSTGILPKILKRGDLVSGEEDGVVGVPAKGTVATGVRSVVNVVGARGCVGGGVGIAGNNWD